MKACASVLVTAALGAMVTACASGHAVADVDRARSPVAAPPGARSPVAAPPLRWSDVTRSPWPASAPDPRRAASASACGERDGALERVAEELAAERARGLGAPDPDRVIALLRQSGEPHVRPRVITASGRAPLDDDALRAELAGRGLARPRCGMAFARTAQQKELFVAIVVDALADLEPLPIRARTGEWLTLGAAIHVPAREARVVVLGPRGAPRTAKAWIDPETRHVRARFVLDRPGDFTVQLVADVAGGPRPLLEARVFADAEPPSGDATPSPAPGEEATGPDDVDTLARMVAALRASESIPPLARDARLDALARVHVERMKTEHTVAHDLGDGDFAARLEGAGLTATLVGENLARARSVALAHRALHASPSHRMNLLRAEYTHVGLAVLTDGGDVYVSEVFAAGLR